MTFFGRWLAAEAVSFILFPIAFVLWFTPNLKYDFIESIFFVLFLQVLSPWGLWLVPFLGGTGFAVAWHIVAEWKASQSS